MKNIQKIVSGFLSMQRSPCSVDSGGLAEGKIVNFLPKFDQKLNGRIFPQTFENVRNKNQKIIHQKTINLCLEAYPIEHG